MFAGLTYLILKFDLQQTFHKIIEMAITTLFSDRSLTCLGSAVLRQSVLLLWSLQLAGRHSGSAYQPDQPTSLLLWGEIISFHDPMTSYLISRPNVKLWWSAVPNSFSLHCTLGWPTSWATNLTLSLQKLSILFYSLKFVVCHLSQSRSVLGCLHTQLASG